MAHGMDSLGLSFDLNEKSGGMFRSYEKSNVHAIDLTSGYAEKKAVEVVEETGPLNVRAVLVCSTFGQSIAKEIVASGENTHLVNSHRGQTQHVTKGLMEVYDVPVVNIWINGLKEATRVQPLQQKVFIMTNDDNHMEFTTWATDELKCGLKGGFPTKNIISNGVSGSMQTSVVQDLVKLIKSNGWDSNLVIIDSDYLGEPDFSVQRIVEHATIRGKDTITYVTKPRSEMAQFDATGVKFDLNGANPRITAIVPGAGPKGTVLGPITVLRKTTLPLLCKWADDHEKKGTMPPPRFAFAAFLSWLVTQTPVYGLEMKHMFSVKTMEGFQFTDNLYEFVAKEKAKIANSLKVQDTDSSLDFATSFSTSDVVKRRLHAQYEAEAEKIGDMRRQAVAKMVDMDLIMPVFEVRYNNMLMTRLKGETVRALPERFSDASLFRHSSRKEHACYTTTSNQYGIKRPTQQEMPMGWSGIRGDFTAAFKGQMFHNTGFVTNRTTSKVHSRLDDFSG